MSSFSIFTYSNTPSAGNYCSCISKIYSNVYLGGYYLFEGATLLTILFAASSIFYLAAAHLLINTNLMLSTIFCGFFAGSMLSVFLNATTGFFKGRMLKSIFVSIMATCWFKYMLGIELVVENKMEVGAFMVAAVVTALATLFTLAWLRGEISEKIKPSNPKETQPSET